MPSLASWVTFITTTAAPLGAQASVDAPVLLDWLASSGREFLGFPQDEEEDELPVAQRAAPDESKWDPLRTLLEGWEFTANYSVTVGTAEHGRLFKYEGGTFTLETVIPTGSTSKWPSAMMFAGLVDATNGPVFSLDDKVSKYLSWWTTDEKDPRSLVTLRHLLSFTSGFGDGSPGEEMNTRAAREWRAKNNKQRAPRNLTERLGAHMHPNDADKCDQFTGDIVECAKSIYANVQLIGTPGQVYSYNSNHLQLAAAVAVTSSGLGIQDVIKKYFVEPYGLKASAYPGPCPDFAGSLYTTGDDYERFLQGVLSYKVLSKEIVDASEQDYTPFMSDFYTLYGNYGFGHFLFCFDSVNGMTDECRAAKVHADPGAFGFIPLIDRKNNYYMQVVSAEIAPTGQYPLSGIPEYLAVAIKPHVDAIMSDQPPAAADHLTHSPGLLSMSIADVNYCVNCKLNPEECS